MGPPGFITGGSKRAMGLLADQVMELLDSSLSGTNLETS